MEQLVQMMIQRNLDINQLKLKDERTINHLVLLQKEKNRTQKENWIIKVLKANKYVNAQLKSDIYYKTIQIMKNHINMENYVEQNKQDLQSGFTEKYINLFVYFYNNFQEANDKIFKNIVRPNNNHIIVDLIKSLVDVHRNMFKKSFTVGAPTNNKNDIQKSPKILKQLPIIASKVFKRDQIIKNIKQQQEKKAKQINIHLDNKYRQFILNINFQQLQKRANETYKMLKENNQKNNSIIQKYRGQCLGLKQKIQYDYDISGLYTKQEMQKMVRSVKDQKQILVFDMDKQVNPQTCSQDQIKQRIKTQFEITESQNYMSIKKDSKIQKWLPLILSRTNLKTLSFQLFIFNNKSKMKFSQFRYQNTQNYLTQYLEFYISQNDMKKSQIKNNQLESIDEQQQPRLTSLSINNMQLKFNKKDFLDFNRKKQFELLQGYRFIARRDKDKDLMLPQLLNIRQKQFLQNLTPAKKYIQKKIRSFSQKRLPNFQSESHDSKLQKIEDCKLLNKKKLDIKFTSAAFMKIKNNESYDIGIQKKEQDKYSLIIRQKASISKLQLNEQNSYRNRIKLLLQKSHQNSEAYNILMKPYQAYQGLKRRENALYTNSFLNK